jgi:REP element-mobilizing transposase RayT
MSPDSRYPARKSIRYKSYDYASAGAYFVTICTKDRAPILRDSLVHSIVTDVWFALPSWFPTIALDEFVVMPNHVHFIVWLAASSVHRPLGPDRQPQGQGCGYEIPACETTRLKPTLGEVVGTWKSLIFLTYHRWAKQHAPGQRSKFWQRNYYERILRHEAGLRIVRGYIRANPSRWPQDPDNLHNLVGLTVPTSIEDYWEDIGRFNRRNGRYISH